MLNSDPWDRFVYPYLTLISDSYNLLHCFQVLWFYLIRKVRTFIFFQWIFDFLSCEVCKVGTRLDALIRYLKVKKTLYENIGNVARKPVSKVSDQV